MARIAFFFLAFALSTANAGLADAYDLRIDPEATHRSRLELRFPDPGRTGVFKQLIAPDSGRTGMTPDFVAAMTLYQAATREEIEASQALAIPWLGDRMPEAFQRAWIGPGGDLIAKVGKGVFQLSIGNYRSNWFWQLNCQLTRWLDGNSEALLSCGDGRERRMQIPGAGTIVIDGVQYRRVFQAGGIPQDAPQESDLQPSRE